LSDNKADEFYYELNGPKEFVRGEKSSSSAVFELADV